MNARAHEAVLKLARGMSAVAERPKHSSAHTTHVTVQGVEFEAHYDFDGEAATLEHAYVTQPSESGLSRVACGQDLIEFLCAIQVHAIEEAIYQQEQS